MEKRKKLGRKLFTPFTTAVRAVSSLTTVSYGCFVVAQW
jgi:hypothetical protein